MYSGTTLTSASGRLVGAHQKIDRVARRHLAVLMDPDGITTGRAKDIGFPGVRSILHFEGRNGPDGIKRKSPAQDEPWHYLSPFDEDDTQLVELIEDHYANLVVALKADDMVVASFEAAWLAHAVVDGLTPAHHYPYEEKLGELRGGLGKESRVTFRDKVVMPGSTKREALRNNWKMWGSKGLLTTHFAFEWGVSSIMLPMRLGENTRPTPTEIDRALSISVGEYFRLTAKEVAALGMYDQFIEHGWTSKMARTVRRQLVPTLIKAVTLLWYRARREADGTLPPMAIEEA